MEGGCGLNSGSRGGPLATGTCNPRGFRNTDMGRPAYLPAMELSEEARSRLADVVELQPTKNAELAERWGMEGGSEVHQYLESELGDYYFRDDNSLIRATEEAADLVDVEPGVESDDDGGRTIRVPPLEAGVAEVVPAPDERARSVVAVLHALEDEGIEADVDDVRSALRSLVNKGVLTTVDRTVPTYKLALPREDLAVEERGERAASAGDDREVVDRIESDFEAV